MKFMPLLFAGVRKLASKPADRPANLTRLRARSRFNASSMQRLHGKQIRTSIPVRKTSLARRDDNLSVRLLTLGFFFQSVALGAGATLVPVRNDSEIERGLETVAGQSNSGLIIA
jgi:hypothetical protein